MYIFFAITFVITAKEETEKTNKTFYKKDPDLIAVFTGDVGRIKLSLEKAKEFKTTKVFITGVYSKNTIEDLIRIYYPEPLPPPLVPDEDGVIPPAAPLDSRPNDGIDQEKIDIDYLASNTIENVIFDLTLFA